MECPDLRSQGVELIPGTKLPSAPLVPMTKSRTDCGGKSNDYILIYTHTNTHTPQREEMHIIKICNTEHTVVKL